VCLNWTARNNPRGSYSGGSRSDFSCGRRRVESVRLLGAVNSLALLVFMGLTACSEPSGTTTSELLLRGLGAEPDSLDPPKAATVEAQTILRDICEGLTTLDRHADVAPGVARTWDVSSDGKTYTFHLRPDAKWSTGERVVGADFVSALRRLADPQTGSAYANFLGVVAHASNIFAGKESPSQLAVLAPDDGTVVIELTSPAAFFPQLLAHPSTCPLHHPTSEGHDKTTSRPDFIVSNGAFVVKEWVPGSHVLLLPNRSYWNHAATRLAGVKYLFIENANDELTRYRAGGLHITSGISRSQFEWVKSHLGNQLHLSPQLGTYFYGFNLDRAPFKGNVKLRRALSLAIDREKLTNAVLRAGEIPAYGWIPPGVNNYTSQSIDSREATAAERLTEARRLYAEAGYSTSHRLHFELRYNNGEAHSRLAIAIAAMWKEALGVDVTLTAEEFKSLLQDIDRGDLPMFRSSWTADYNDAYSFAQVLDSTSGVNLTHYRNTSYDKLLIQAQAETDLKQRQLLLQNAERTALADQPLIPLYFYVNKHLVAPEIEGWYDNVMSVVYSKDLSFVPRPARR
jgi:oligopeptide transport system substrate-binding protein